MNIINSSKNPTVKKLKQLKEKKHRDIQKKFFIEGTRFFEEALKEDATIEELILSESFVSAGGKIFDNILKLGLPYQVFGDRLFCEISDTINPQGIFAVIKFQQYSIDNMISDKSFIIVLDSIQDPGNLGTILRTADGTGATGMIISKGCVDVYNPKVLRSTMGSIFRIPFIIPENVSETLSSLKQKQINIFASDIKESTNCFGFKYPDNLAIIIGNEANGISKEVLSFADNRVKIPMLGEIESFNAAVAAGILMYEVMKQRITNEK